jgi:hypothetical protein
MTTTQSLEEIQQNMENQGMKRCDICYEYGHTIFACRNEYCETFLSSLHNKAISLKYTGRIEFIDYFYGLPVSHLKLLCRRRDIDFYLGKIKKVGKRRIVNAIYNTYVKLRIASFTFKYNMIDMYKTDEMCPICMNTINHKDTVRTHCEHNFCSKCVNMLYKNANIENENYVQCPLCREKVVELSVSNIDTIKCIEQI